MSKERNSKSSHTLCRFALNRANPWFSILLVKPHPKPDTNLASVDCCVLLSKSPTHKPRDPAEMTSRSPFLRLLKGCALFHSHDLDVIEIFCYTPHYSALWINLTLFDHPRLCPGDNTLWCPSRQSASLENEASCE